MVDLALSSDQQDIVDEARAVARRCLATRAAEHDRDASFPTQSIADLHDAGLLGLLVPTEYGGTGADLTAWGLAVAELAEACGSTALIFAMHSGAARLLAADAPTNPVAERVLKEITTEGRLLSWAFSEPGTGGNILNPQLRATPDGDEVHLRGTKAFCTGAGHADYYLINAHSGETEFRRSQTMALVPAAQDGLAVKETWDAMGMRANSANTLLLDCRIPATHCVGGPGGGMPRLTHALPALILGLASASSASPAPHKDSRTSTSCAANSPPPGSLWPPSKACGCTSPTWRPPSTPPASPSCTAPGPRRTTRWKPSARST